MKIYRVSIVDVLTGTTDHKLHTGYQSAAQSYAYWARSKRYDATFTVAHVPDEAWKPVDKVLESKLGQVQQLWDQLVAADSDALDALLDELVKRVQPAKPAPVLGEMVRGEAEALLKLDLLAGSK